MTLGTAVHACDPSMPLLSVSFLDLSVYSTPKDGVCGSNTVVHKFASVGTEVCLVVGMVLDLDKVQKENPWRNLRTQLSIFHFDSGRRKK